ncbi:hypothetical protein [Aureimonas sp. ME7]|uniref:hypothetical protein n=1 Tax=Aureimonas sp. ME7 TaxID=2744252 RepID=UPI0015F67C0C|nr:hypothetical protein [Aureimonas sp. ME7]
MIRLTASALLLAAGLAGAASAQTVSNDDFSRRPAAAREANGLPGVGLDAGTAGREGGTRGPGGLQNGVGAYGVMTPDASGAAGNTLSRVPGAVPEGSGTGFGIPLGGPAGTNG